MEDFPEYPRRPSCDSLALAMCDPGMRRKDSSECEEDSLPELYIDSGLSTLRGSHGGYDSEQEAKGPEEEEEKEMEDIREEHEDKESMTREDSDTEVRRQETQVSVPIDTAAMQNMFEQVQESQRRLCPAKYHHSSILTMTPLTRRCPGNHDTV